MQTFEDTIYQFIACKNHVLFVFNSDDQRTDFLLETHDLTTSLVPDFFTHICKMLSFYFIQSIHSPKGKQPLQKYIYLIACKGSSQLLKSERKI